MVVFLLACHVFASGTIDLTCTEMPGCRQGGGGDDTGSDDTAPGDTADTSRHDTTDSSGPDDTHTGDSGQDTGDTGGDTAVPLWVCGGVNDADTFDDDSFMGGATIAMELVPAADLDVARLEVFTGESVGLSHVALWADDGASGQPLEPLASGSFVEAAANGWQGADLDTCVTVPAGVRVWVLWQPVGGDQSSIEPTSSADAVNITYWGSFDGWTWDGPYSGPWKYRVSCCS